MQLGDIQLNCALPSTFNFIYLKKKERSSCDGGSNTIGKKMSVTLPRQDRHWPSEKRGSPVPYLCLVELDYNNVKKREAAAGGRWWGAVGEVTLPDTFILPGIIPSGRFLVSIFFRGDSHY